MRPEIDYGTRSKYEGKAWRCSCGANNLPTRKLIFSIPKFHCECGKSVSLLVCIRISCLTLLFLK